MSKPNHSMGDDILRNEILWINFTNIKFLKNEITSHSRIVIIIVLYYIDAYITIKI